MSLLRNPRVWIYLLVGLVAAGLIWYDHWRNSDAQRLQRCIDASVSEMKQSNPELSKFDNAEPIFADVSRGSCKKQLGIT
ncbi:hypothetical protein [Mycolicibacterium sp.]|jgi:hypothetical protein|uniref:hypothetical protein n=1 Tax=Mycolicibacterium sp. TaxID=2320850 RepID=UPI001A1A892B|nr:hypothetical protein [Mycolicibacterium sp.]MBJ7401078.1 hypothetical protein [Mycolicibacterium sp.]